MPAWLVPAIMAGAQMVSQLISNRSQKRSQERTNLANMEMAKYAYNKDLDMWNRQNQYNTPASQMSRYSEAGLNPNLIYGQGNSGNASNAPSYQRPQLDYTRRPTVAIPEVLGMYQDYQMKQAQIDNVKAATENIAARTASESLRPGLISIQKATGDQRLKELLSSYAPRMQQFHNVAESGELRIREQLENLKGMKLSQQLRALQALREEKYLKTMSLQQESIAADNLFKQYRNEWMKEGITTSDNLFVRIMARMMGLSGLAQDAKYISEGWKD